MNIQIPKSIIKNPQLGSNDFLMVVWMKRLIYSRGKELKIWIREIKDQLGFNDTRTIKKSLEKLLNEGIIEEFTVGKYYIELSVNESKLIELPFAQLPEKILNYVKEIGSTGLRLLYYYESHINRKTEKPFCYTSVRTIAKETGLSDKTIKSYNDALKRKKLLKVVRHGFEEEYDEFDDLIINKYNNHYYVLLENF